jgi:2-C-methyl-D-erythritol 4-phosphate cytidylyltransferase
MKTAAVIVAAGSGQRFGGDVPKQFRTLVDRPMLAWSISRMEAVGLIDSIVVVVAEEHLVYASQNVIDPYGFRKVIKLVPGGTTRQESVYRGLRALPISTGLVAIHDGARPMTAVADIQRVLERARTERAAILAAPVTDTIKRAKGGYVMGSVDRRDLFGAQTPQAFQYDLIMSTHEAAREDQAQVYTDDASLVEARGFKVTLVEPQGPNIKITSTADLVAVEALLRREIDG